VRNARRECGLAYPAHLIPVSGFAESAEKV
jgi:hypothetical protein